MIKKYRLSGHSIGYRVQGHRLFGFTLSVIGFFWLANKIGWIPVPEVEMASVWPVVVILLGLFMVLHTRKAGNKLTKDDVD
jgi:hypothetical protein